MLHGMASLTMCTTRSCKFSVLSLAVSLQFPLRPEARKFAAPLPIAAVASIKL